jgi:predicted glutamine amidotransferase
MCRLFAMSAAPQRVRATFWLVEASDSLVQQSRREPDGTGLGTFDAQGRPVVEKQPVAAYEDELFAREARERESETFVAHIRYASTGGLDVSNTHPFCQHDRLFAHNGVISGLDDLDRELGAYRDLVAGDTDSERFFALITKCVDDHDGDVTGGVVAAARWVAENLPLYAINLVLTTEHEMWALRYPDTHDLFVLDRRAGGAHGDRHLDHASPAGTVRARSADLARHPAVVVASERMDEAPGWRAMRPGELVHVAGSLHVTSQQAIDHPPVHLLSLEQLSPHAAASQTRS